MARVYRLLIAALGLALLGAFATGMMHRPTALERVQEAGVLRMVTLPGPATFSHATEGPSGIEYDLASAFADYLGVELDVLIADSKMDVYHALATGAADLAAAGLNANPERAGNFRFTEPFISVEQYLVYRFGERRPEDLAELVSMEGADLKVTAYGSHLQHLRALLDEYPDLAWQEVAGSGTEELLYRVWNREVEFTVADSIDLQLTQQFYPELRVAFSLDSNRELVWAFVRGRDDTLFRASENFFLRARETGKLVAIEERYLGHVGTFDYVGARVFLRHITERLPTFREKFKQAGRDTGVDWRLLAAIGYQESHWNPRAVSPTGVRGIMMLTQRTAQELGVTDRRDPAQSIDGGARYFAGLRERIPGHIEEPVRTWLALAAYNVGMGHLDDARRLTEMRAGDPDSWTDVKSVLPLLAEREWYEQTRYGYARGAEPVTFVSQVRTYYDLLLRITDREPGEIVERFGRPYDPLRQQTRSGLGALLPAAL